MNAKEKNSRALEIINRLSELNERYREFTESGGKIVSYIEITQEQREELERNRQEHKRLTSELLGMSPFF